MIADWTECVQSESRTTDLNLGAGYWSIPGLSSLSNSTAETIAKRMWVVHAQSASRVTLLELF